MSTRAALSTDSSLPIQTIRVTVHSTGRFFASDTRSGNHVSIYLLTGDGKSVRLNMFKAGPTDTLGTYQVRRCRYERSVSEVKAFDLRPAEGLVVGDVLDMVEREGRGRYRLAKSGLGCRFWVATVIDDMAKSGYISSSSPLDAASVTESLSYNYSMSEEPQFEPIVQGTFLLEEDV